MRCRAHNQFTAEQTFGREFMENKREESRRAADRAHESATERAEARAHADAEARAEELAHAEAAASRAAAAERAKELDVIPWLRKLGIRADEAQRLSTLCESIPDAPIEQRLKYALSCLDTRARLRQPAAA